MKTINEITEREYLLSIPASEVLKYIKEKSFIPNTYDFMEYKFRNDYEIAHSTVEALIKKNDRLIDMALCLNINDDEQIEKILLRNTKNSVIDSEILSAILSNREAVISNMLHIPSWLNKRISWIINSGSDEHIEILFRENISIPYALANVVLELKNKKNDDKYDEYKFIDKKDIKISDERFLFIIVMLLENPAIQHKPRRNFGDTYLGYGTDKRTLQNNIWNLLLTLPVNYSTAYNVASCIQTFHSLDFTFEFKNSLIPFDFSRVGRFDDKKIREEIDEEDLEYHKVFLENAITRWDILLKSNDEESVYTKRHVQDIKKYMIAKIETYGENLFKLQDYLLDKNDESITEGFFANTYSIKFSRKKIFDNFDEYLKKYGRPFLLGLMNHDELFLKSGYYEIKIKFQNAIFDFKEPKDIEEYESLENYFNDRADELFKKNPKRYIESLYHEYIDNENEEIPDDKFSDLYEKLESHFKDIKEDNDNKENQKEIINYLSDIQSNYTDLENKNIDDSQRIEEQQHNYYEKILGLQSDASIFLIIIIILLIIVIFMLF